MQNPASIALLNELTANDIWGAWRTIAGYEAIHMIRESQACWSAAGAKVGLLHRLGSVATMESKAAGFDNL
jgi:hypothetical protein